MLLLAPQLKEAALISNREKRKVSGQKILPQINPSFQFTVPLSLSIKMHQNLKLKIPRTTSSTATEQLHCEISNPHSHNQSKPVSVSFCSRTNKFNSASQKTATQIESTSNSGQTWEPGTHHISHLKPAASSARLAHQSYVFWVASYEESSAKSLRAPQSEWTKLSH